MTTFCLALYVSLSLLLVCLSWFLFVFFPNICIAWERIYTTAFYFFCWKNQVWAWVLVSEAIGRCWGRIDQGWQHWLQLQYKHLATSLTVTITFTIPAITFTTWRLWMPQPPCCCYSSHFFLLFFTFFKTPVARDSPQPPLLHPSLLFNFAVNTACALKINTF